MPQDALSLLLDRPQYANVADDAYAPGLTRMETFVESSRPPSPTSITARSTSCSAK